jgi:hypothetical protein
VLGALALLLAGGAASAAEPDPELDVLAVEVHGFVSQGFMLTTGNDYIAEHSTDGSFELTEIGINFTKKLGDNFGVGLQLFAQDFGITGDYRPRADWFYLDYRFRDWLGLRVGRLKIPYGLHNESVDIDSARVPVLLPPSVYPLQNREILFAHSGAELYGFLRLPALGALDYRLFGGTIFLDSDSLTPPRAQLELEFYVPYVFGGRLLWELPVPGLRIGASVEAVRLETTVTSPLLPAPLEIESDNWLWVGSAEYLAGELTLTAEYSRWFGHQTSNDATLSPEIESESERAYAMASYRVRPWFHPGVYYSLLFPEVSQREGRENVQHDVALTLRFDINSHWLLKLEGHYLNGTAGLVNSLRINPPDISTADRQWAAFFVKTTAHF